MAVSNSFDQAGRHSRQKTMGSGCSQGSRKRNGKMGEGDGGSQFLDSWKLVFENRTCHLGGYTGCGNTCFLGAFPSVASVAEAKILPSGQKLKPFEPR